MDKVLHIDGLSECVREWVDVHFLYLIQIQQALDLLSKFKHLEDGWEINSVRKTTPLAFCVVEAMSRPKG